MDNTANVIAALALLLGMIGGYVKLETKIKELEIRIQNREKQDDRVIEKLDNIADDITDIKIELQNKQNRP